MMETVECAGCGRPRIIKGYHRVDSNDMRFCMGFAILEPCNCDGVRDKLMTHDSDSFRQPTYGERLEAGFGCDGN